MKSNRDIVIGDGSSFEELIDVLMTGPNSPSPISANEHTDDGVDIDPKTALANIREWRESHERSKRQRR